MDIGKRIQTARKAKKLTQKQLAEKLGVATGTIQQYELGKRTPGLETVLDISDALEVSSSYFFGAPIDNDYSVVAAQKMYTRYTESKKISEAIKIILEALYGKSQEIPVHGKYSQSTVVVYGDGDDAIFIEEGVFLAIQSAIEGVTRAIVSNLGIEKGRAIQEETEFLSSEATRNAAEACSIEKENK